MQSQKVCAKPQMSLTFSQMYELATSDVQSILEIPVTDELRMENRNHGLDLAEQRQRDLRVNSCI